jgi:hypothetical protein
VAYMIGQYLRTTIPLRPVYPPGTEYTTLTRDLPFG